MLVPFIIISLLAQILNNPSIFPREWEKKYGQNKNLRKLDELSDDIVILHVNDIHCGLNDTIGYDGFKLYYNELKSKYKNVITVDVGDHVQGGTLGALSDGSAIINVMNKVGFDVAILGNHEFDYGVEQLSKLGDNITSKYICSNFCYHKNKTTIFEPYKIIEIGEKKIAFIGLLTPLTLTKTYLIGVYDEDGKLLYDFLEGEENKLLYETLQKYIDEVRNKGSDYVILLTHMGMSVEQYKSEDFLSNLKNVSAILDGHTHKIYNVTSKDKDGKDIYIAQTGTKLQSVGKLTIKSDGSITSEIIEEIPEPNNKTNAIKVTRSNKERWVDKEISEFIDEQWKEYENELFLVIGHSNIDFIVRPDEGESHVVECRYKECTLGNFICDAIREGENGDISIYNGGSVRTNLKKGNITKSQIIDVLPFFNNILVKQVTGQNILDALEFGVSKYPKESGGFPQVSGITFDLDTSFNSTVLIDESGMFINVTGKRRVSNVKINGEELNLTKIYNAALNEFIGKGGDGYSMFINCNIINESIFTDTDSVIYYIQNTLKGEIPEKYKNEEGRINFYNKTENPNNNTNSSLPNILLLGFDNYQYIPNQKLFNFLTHLRFNNYSNINVNNVTLLIDLFYNNLLRNLEEMEID